MLIPMGGHVVSLCKEAPPRVIHAYRRRWWHKNELPSRGSGGDNAMSAAAAERTPRTTRTTRRASRARGGEAGAQHGGEAARAGGLGGASCVEPHEQQQRPTDGEKRVHTPGSCAPLVVLVNDASASSAEVFAGASRTPPAPRSSAREPTARAPRRPLSTSRTATPPLPLHALGGGAPGGKPPARASSRTCRGTGARRGPSEPLTTPRSSAH